MGSRERVKKGQLGGKGGESEVRGEREKRRQERNRRELAHFAYN